MGVFLARFWHPVFNYATHYAPCNLLICRLDGAVLARNCAPDARLDRSNLRPALCCHSVGYSFLGHQIGSFIGVWVGGYAYQVTGSYTIMWWAGIVLAVVAAVLCLPIKEQPLDQPAAA